MLQGKILDMFLLISSLRSRKILIVVVLQESEMINSIGNTYQTKVKYTNVFLPK
jgi:hypothetical protein